jgi:putative transposase
VPDPAVTRPSDLVERDFVAPAPNRTWVADFPHMAAWSGTVHVAFVLDTFSRRIVGWSVATTNRAELLLAALEMALWHPDHTGTRPETGELTHHSDSEYVEYRMFPGFLTSQRDARG